MACHLYLYTHLDDFIDSAISSGLSSAPRDLTDCFSIFTAVWCGAMILPVLGLAFSVIGLVRVERPRWPSIVGLVLCGIPISFWACVLGWDYIKDKNAGPSVTFELRVPSAVNPDTVTNVALMSKSPVT